MFIVAEEKAKEIVLEDDRWQSSGSNTWPNILTSMHQLISAITERYKFLPDLGCRMKFLENLQKPLLLETFLRDAIQQPETLYAHEKTTNETINEKIKIVCSQCNFCLGVIDMLQDWEDDPLFIELHEYCQVKEDESLFSAEIEAFRKKLNSLLMDQLIPLCSERFQGNARSYSRQIAPVINPSPLLCKLLVELDSDLHEIRSSLGQVLLKDFEKSLFTHIDQVLFEEVKRHARVWDHDDAMLWFEDLKHVWQSRNQSLSQFTKYVI